MNSKHTHAFFAGMVAVAAVAPFLLTQPALAGSWTLTGTASGGYTAGSSGTGLEVQSTSDSVNVTDYAILSYSSEALIGNIKYTGTIKWVPNGTLASDPAPATVTLTETGDVYGELAYHSGPGVTLANDGLGDPPVTTYYTGYPAPAQTTTSQGTHTTVIAVPAGGSYTFTRTFTNEADGTGLEECLVSYQASV